MENNQNNGNMLPQTVQIVTEEKKPLYDIRLNQNDLVEYVTSKEKARVNEALAIEVKKLEKINSEIEEFTKNGFKKILDLILLLEKVFVSSFKKGSKFFLDSHPNEYMIRNVMDGIQRKGKSKYEDIDGGVGNLVTTAYSGEHTVKQRLALIVNDKNDNLVCVRIVNTPPKIKSQLEKEYKTLKKQAEEQNKIVTDLKNRLRDIENNSVVVKNKLIEEHLSKSNEGKDLLGKLNKIKLTGDTTKFLK